MRKMFVISGPWCADRAALVLLIQIEKLKVKTPYERHFLLLCMVSSVLMKIRYSSLDCHITDFRLMRHETES